MTITIDGSSQITMPDSSVIKSGKQSCKAWVNFDGTITGTNIPRNNFNVSSVTRNSTGDYTINFTNAFVDANYAIVCGGNGQPSGTTSGGFVFPYYKSASTTTTSPTATPFAFTVFTRPPPSLEH